MEARAGKLTASRVACLMEGNAERILQLYLEMIGEAVPEDLSDVWPVQLGSATEALQLDWFERRQRQIVSRRGEVVNHPALPWAAATLDGWIDELSCPIEVKHTSGREPAEVLVARYSPQVQWQMEVTGATQCAFSVIFGAAEPVVDFLERDDGYIRRSDRARQTVHGLCRESDSARCACRPCLRRSSPTRRTI